ncbi:MAG: hypothetical protein QOJ17_1560 [Rhodospirillaceae bacterium]|nr:hypothetical protein [Rhodospirillaceae bacterium]
MGDLLSSVLEAHGGLERWHGLKSGAATIVSGGELLDRKAPQSPEPRQVTIGLHELFAAIAPFGGPDRRASFRPDRVMIETTAGQVLAERTNPRASFAGHDLDTKWDPLQRAYFGGYATWIYLNAPFMFTMPGVRTEEIAPVQEKRETWRGLRVTLPAGIASHSPVQDFYFGEDFLMRRQDYTLDVAAGCNVANYALGMSVANGIKIPSRRRAYLCDDRYRVLYDRLLIWIDFSNISYS